MNPNRVSFSIPKQVVEPTDKALIESALPAGFHLAEQLDGVNYEICANNIYGYSIGTVHIESDRIVFEIGHDNFGPRFMRELKEKYPQCDPDRIVWVIFFEWYGKWSFYGALADRDTTVQNASGFHLARNAYLCSVKASEFKGDCVTSISSQTIREESGIKYVGDDEGPKDFELTTLEVFVSENPDENTYKFGLNDLELL